MSTKRSEFPEGSEDEMQGRNAKKIRFVDLTSQELNFVDMTNVDASLDASIEGGQKMQSNCENKSVIECVIKLKPDASTTNVAPLANKAKMSATKLTKSELDILEAKKYFKEECWWLDHDIPVEERCTIQDCTFEPVPHRIHRPSEGGYAFYSLIEKKILVKYLIKKDQIQSAMTRIVYKSMIQDGYLSHRSEHALRICFCRSIINKIEKYDLSPSHAAQFNHTRDLIERNKRND